MAREMIGYLIVRGGVHQEAYAKALSDLSGADVTKLLHIPEIDSMQFPHAKKFIDQGFHRILYRFSPNDYTQLSEIWNGEQFDTGEPARSRTARRRVARCRTSLPPRRSTPPASTPRTSRRSPRGWVTR